LLDPLHDELGDTLSARDRESSITEVDEEHLHLTPVVAIKGSRAVEHRYTMVQRQTGARSHLRLEAGWQLNY
jgi:hypothetical protein